MNDKQINKIPLLDNEVDLSTGMEENLDGLSIEIDDNILAKTISDRVNASEDYWTSEVDLRDRQKMIEKYLLGEQLDDKKLHPSEKKYQEKSKAIKSMLLMNG